METKIHGPVKVEGDVEVIGHVFSEHDAIYRHGSGGLESNATLVGVAPAKGPARYSVAVGEVVNGDVSIPGDWDNVAVRFEEINESAGAGTVIWTFNYHLRYPLLANGNVTAAGTDIVLPAIIQAGQNISTYRIPAELAAIPTPSVDFFGTPLSPVMRFSFTRTGGTLVGESSISQVTFTRG